MIDRRSFLIASLAACASQAVKGKPPAPPAKKTILILGGTGFLGPHVVDVARARGHTVTLFNRGKTHPGLFPDVEKLHGDRDGHLEALQGRKWDAVLDTSGYVPRIVTDSAKLLGPNVGHYIFISTVSVYKNESTVGADESDPVATIADPKTEQVTPESYGALKALCEQAAEAAMPGRVASLRSGLIIGPGDPTGRFTHWPSRMAEGGEVLAPGDGSTPVQYIDGRDLAALVVTMIENKSVGVYNAFGPAAKQTMREALEAVNHASGDKAKLVWVPASFLEENKVTEWGDMPMWLDNKGENAGFGTRSNKRAIAAGATFRPIADTARDTLAWLATLDEAKREKVASSGIKRDRELAVIAAWRAKQTG